MRYSIASRVRLDSPIGRMVVRSYGLLHGVNVTFAPDWISFRQNHAEVKISPRDFPFSRDLITSFGAYHGSIEPDSSGVVDYSRPGTHRYVRTGLAFSLPGIAEEDDAIEAYFRWFTPARGDTVFDIGAHAGVSTYTLATTVGPLGRVFAFEPDPTSLEHLRRNVADHGLANVTIVPKAVAGQRGRLSFHAEGSLGSTLADVASRPSSGNVIEVDAITLADAFALAGCAPTYVKVDIEGAELGMIEGSLEMLRKNPVHFALDSNHRVRGKLTASALERLFASIGYEAESSDAYGFMTTWARPV